MTLFQYLTAVFALVLFSPFLSHSLAAAPNSVFSFHLLGEPYSLDPVSIRGTSGTYLLGNVFHGLYRYSNLKGLIPVGAKECLWLNSKAMECRLNPEAKFSDGSSVEAKHYVTSFRRLVSASTKTVQSEILINLKNARAILAKDKAPNQLGVTALDKYRLRIEFDQYDKEFLYKLTYPNLTPLKTASLPVRKEALQLVHFGPYSFESWHPGKKITLTPNPHYNFAKQQNKPPVVVYFVDDDSTGLRMFETGQLSFLRRLVTSEIPRFKKHPGFLQLPMARFDYIGFSPELSPHFHLRKALAHSLRYTELKDLYHALGLPGCPSLPRRLLPSPPCHSYNLNEAKASLKKAMKTGVPSLHLAFSRLGGDDIKKGMEWIQHQWSKNLGLQVELRPKEQGMYLQELKTRPPLIFRKGVGMDRPTCLAALEVFAFNSPENFIQLNDNKYERILKKLQQATDLRQKTKLCRQGVKRLLQSYLIIPLGEIHFTMLHNGKFKGWQLNEMNQLDLTELTRAQ